MTESPRGARDGGLAVPGRSPETVFIDIDAKDVARPAAPPGEGPVVAIGVFDGLHLGHQNLLRAGLSMARTRSLPLWALTFWPHPEEILRGLGRVPERAAERVPGFLLTTLDDKLHLLGLCGAEKVLVLRFTREAASVSPEEFVSRTLATGVGASVVVVGFNFTFGQGGRGRPALLADLGRRAGMEVAVHPAVRLGGEVVSSTGVRAALDAGDVGRAAMLLGRPYSLAGEVRSGAGRGRKLGFPTANVAIPAELARPADGVYVCAVRRGPDPFLRIPEAEAAPAVANLGTSPTFASGDAPAPRRLEVHLLAGDPPGYGEPVRVFFLKRLRPERRFPGPDELAAQIRADRAAARAFFGQSR